MAILSREEIVSLAEKQLKGTLTEKEAAILKEWLETTADLKGETKLEWTGPDRDETALRDRLLASILADAGMSPGGKTVPLKTAWSKVKGVAAILLLLIGLTAALVWWVKPSDRPGKSMLTGTVDIAPGYSGAVLKLANGRQILLDSTKEGVVASTQNNGENIIFNNGTLRYESGPGVAEESTASASNALNEIRTPYGRQLKVVLPDGTKAWLNAGSVIKFPVAFGPRFKRRWLEMSGEVYFEVAKRKNIMGEPTPFIVKAGGQEVEVLGTHFDVKAYPDDTEIKTTLAEGKVRVRAAGVPAVTLNPGQQSSFQTRANSIKVKEVDAEAVTGWTRGLFVFHNASIQEVMHQFSRWYNVQVDYGAHLPQRTFSGKIYRDLNASEALAALSFMKLHFQILSRPGSGELVIKVTP